MTATVDLVQLAIRRWRTTDLAKRGVMHVRTEAGVKKFGLPIGTVIKAKEGQSLADAAKALKKVIAERGVKDPAELRRLAADPVPGTKFYTVAKGSGKYTEYSFEADGQWHYGQGFTASKEKMPKAVEQWVADNKGPVWATKGTGVTGPGPSNAEKIKNAETMYGTNSPQYREATLKYGADAIAEVVAEKMTAKTGSMTISPTTDFLKMNVGASEAPIGTTYSPPTGGSLDVWTKTAVNHWEQADTDHIVVGDATIDGYKAYVVKYSLSGSSSPIPSPASAKTPAQDKPPTFNGVTDSIGQFRDVPGNTDPAYPFRDYQGTLHNFGTAYTDNELPLGSVAQVKSYTGSWAGTVNTGLRSGEVSENSTGVKHMDAAMRPMTEDTMVFRSAPTVSVGVGHMGSAQEVYDALNALTGKVITDKGYLSSSYDLDGSTVQGAPYMVLRIRAPKGTPAIFAQPFSGYQSEHEVILSRHLPFKVNKVEWHRDGVNGSNMFVLDVTAQPEKIPKKISSRFGKSVKKTTKPEPTPKTLTWNNLKSAPEGSALMVDGKVMLTKKPGGYWENANGEQFSSSETAAGGWEPSQLKKSGAHKPTPGRVTAQEFADAPTGTVWHSSGGNDYTKTASGLWVTKNGSPVSIPADWAYGSLEKPSTAAGGGGDKGKFVVDHGTTYTPKAVNGFEWHWDPVKGGWVNTNPDSKAMMDDATMQAYLTGGYVKPKTPTPGGHSIAFASYSTGDQVTVWDLDTREKKTLVKTGPNQWTYPGNSLTFTDSELQALHDAGKLPEWNATAMGALHQPPAQGVWYSGTAVPGPKQLLDAIPDTDPGKATANSMAIGLQQKLLNVEAGSEISTADGGTEWIKVTDGWEYYGDDAATQRWALNDMGHVSVPNPVVAAWVVARKGVFEEHFDLNAPGGNLPL